MADKKANDTNNTNVISSFFGKGEGLAIDKWEVLSMTKTLNDARDKPLRQENRSGKHRASQLPRKFANLLYKEFVAFFSP